MSMFNWLKKMRQGPPPEVSQAREIMHRISKHVEVLNEHLKTYQKAKDPFTALMADLYTRDQLSRVHRGPINGHG